MGAEESQATLSAELLCHLAKCRREFQAGATAEVLEYLWLYVAADKEHADGELENLEHMRLNDWLNVVDEAAALGAKWLIVCSDEEQCKDKDVVEICKWAQSIHNMKTAIHLHGTGISDTTAHNLIELSRKQTYLLVDYENNQGLESLKEMGFMTSQANSPCNSPDLSCSSASSNMLCVDPHGRLYSCGLLLGDERFCLGHASEDRFDRIIADSSGPHKIPSEIGGGGESKCRACPRHSIEGKCGEEN